MYMRNIADIWTDIRIADTNWSYLRSNADIPKLGDISRSRLKEV